MIQGKIDGILMDISRYFIVLGGDTSAVKKSNSYKIKELDVLFAHGMIGGGYGRNAMRIFYPLIGVCLLLSVANAPLHAEVIKIAPEQQYMLKAAQYVMAKKFQEAESLYSQVIAANNQYIDAYLQRAVIRRELGNQNGSAGDAVIATRLADRLLQNSPQNARLYYQRASGYRLLKEFAKARADYNMALSLNNTSAWRADLQAMALEEKMGK